MPITRRYAETPSIPESAASASAAERTRDVGQKYLLVYPGL